MALPTSADDAVEDIMQQTQAVVQDYCARAAANGTVHAAATDGDLVNAPTSAGGPAETSPAANTSAQSLNPEARPQA
jgi:hypothetical protein